MIAIAIVYNSNSSQCRRGQTKGEERQKAAPLSNNRSRGERRGRRRGKRHIVQKQHCQWQIRDEKERPQQNASFDMMEQTFTSTKQTMRQIDRQIYKQIAQVASCPAAVCKNEYTYTTIESVDSLDYWNHRGRRRRTDGRTLLYNSRLLLLPTLTRTKRWITYTSQSMMMMRGEADRERSKKERRKRGREGQERRIHTQQSNHKKKFKQDKAIDV